MRKIRTNLKNFQCRGEIRIKIYYKSICYLTVIVSVGTSVSCSRWWLCVVGLGRIICSCCSSSSILCSTAITIVICGWCCCTGVCSSCSGMSCSCSSSCLIACVIGRSCCSLCGVGACWSVANWVTSLACLVGSSCIGSSTEKEKLNVRKIYHPGYRVQGTDQWEEIRMG